MSAKQEHTQLAILFADISGSTALYEKLGNEQALHLVNLTLDILTHEMLEHRGVLIKTIGDEIICTFPDVVAAINAACAMQLAMEKQHPGGESPIYIRIGLHYGEVILESGDIFGDAVNVAARVTAITRARQIMASQSVVDLLPMELHKKARPVMRTALRGKKEAFVVYQFPWEQDDTMSTRIGMFDFRKPAESQQALMLRYRKQIFTINDKLKSILLGRGDTCDLMIWNNLASREHARIEYSFGKSLITDHSVNGTYILFADNQVIRLHHQQIVLHGAGTISLGQSFSEDPSELIEFILQ